MKIESVEYRLDWRKFRRGYSFFVPCVNTDKARKALARTTKRLGIDIVTKVVIVDGIKGLRVWRV